MSVLGLRLSASSKILRKSTHLLKKGGWATWLSAHCLLSCQRLNFGASKASKLSRSLSVSLALCQVNSLSFSPLPPPPLSGTSSKWLIAHCLLSCQRLYFCTSKASKLSTCRGIIERRSQSPSHTHPSDWQCCVRLDRGIGLLRY